jgi:sugar phosphate isomerase/epimerase
VEALNGDLVLEVDTFWVHHAGVEVVDYLHTHQKDIALVHVKDGKDGTPMALGEGTAPVKAVVKAAEEIGLEWLIVENDNPTPNGLADSERSFAYLKTNC